MVADHELYLGFVYFRESLKEWMRDSLRSGGVAGVDVKGLRTPPGELEKALSDHEREIYI